jgi:predicted CoA-binding protein
MADNQNSADFLATDDVIAVVGVSTNQDKYGYKVFFDLFQKGYTVYAIHPDGGEVNGIKRYRDLKSLPVKPTLVVSVVPPTVTKKIILECVSLGITKIWLQPGSDDPEVIALCRKNQLRFIAEACIMVKSLKK